MTDDPQLLELRERLLAARSQQSFTSAESMYAQAMRSLYGDACDRLATYRGFVATLSDEQRAAALAYDGPIASGDAGDRE